MVNFFQITEIEILNIIDFFNQYKDNIKSETNFIQCIKSRNLLILVISILLFLICLLTFFNIISKNVSDKEDNYEKLDINYFILNNLINKISINYLNKFSLFNSYYTLI